MLLLFGCIEAGFAILRDHSGKVFATRKKPDRKDVIANARATCLKKSIDVGFWG